MTNFAEPPEHGVEIMVDLETMGTTPYSPVIAIGAVRFEAGPMQAMAPFYQAITLESCLKVGLRIKADTVLWWMKQSAQAKQVFEDPEAVDLPLALDAFTDWLGSRPDYLWGNSAAFDLGLLADAYRSCGKEVPWAFYRERCYRTLKSLPGMDQFKLQRSGTHHNALDDAISQAHHCRDMLVYMKSNQPGMIGSARGLTNAAQSVKTQPAATVEHHGLAQVTPEGGVYQPDAGVWDTPESEAQSFRDLPDAADLQQHVPDPSEPPDNVAQQAWESLGD